VRPNPGKTIIRWHGLRLESSRNFLITPSVTEEGQL
jgi:hypothetical protein